MIRALNLATTVVLEVLTMAKILMTEVWGSRRG
jgi:hypothetical protein